MTSSFSRILALTLVVLAINTEAVPFVTQFVGCTNSDNGIENEQLFFASTCQRFGSPTQSLGVSCSTNEAKVFNSTDCTGTVLIILNETCLPVQGAGFNIRIECEDVNDAEYLRRRTSFGANGQPGPGCDPASPVVTSFTRLNKCFDGITSTDSFKYEKVNATAYKTTQYTAVGCNPADEAETLTLVADGSCESGNQVDFILAGDVGNSAGLVRISGYILSFALTFAGILVMM